MGNVFAPSRSKTEIVLDFIAETKYVWAIGAVAVILAVIMGYVNIPHVAVPSAVKAGVIIFIAVSPLSYVLSKKLIGLFYEPEYEFLIRVDAAAPDPVQVYATKKEVMNRLDITDGAAHTYRSNGGYLVHILRHVDPEAWTAEGTWIGEVTDMELMNDRERIDAQRRKNRKWAVIGQKLYARFGAIADSVESKYFTNMARKELELANYDPEVVLEEVADNIEEFDADDTTDPMDVLNDAGMIPNTAPSAPDGSKSAGDGGETSGGTEQTGDTGG